MKGSIATVLRRTVSLSFGIIMALAMGAIIIGGTAAPAAAACSPPDGEWSMYKFTNVVKTSRPTNLYSDYITTGSNGGSITYNRTTTASVSASMTATVSAEAGIVFAKASASIGVTVGAGYSWSDSFSYTLNVGPYKTARMRMYTESRQFDVTKWRYNGSTCKYELKYSNQRANAPRATHINTWKLEYK